MNRLLLCLIICCMACLPAAAADTAPAKGLKIGYVDINKVLNQYARRNDLDNELNNIRLTMQAKDETSMDEINALSKSIEQLAMGTPERAALQEKLRSAQEALNKFRGDSYDVMTREVMLRMEALSDDIMGIVAALGREQGYDFILKDQSPAPEMMEGVAPPAPISQRVVLYAKPEYDLTAEVSRRLNEAYAARKTDGAGKSGKPAESSDKKRGVGVQ